MKVDIKGPIISNDEKWIYDWCKIEATCPKDVQTAIENANGEKLETYINSGGGSIFAGSEIYALLSQYNGPIEQFVVGMAGSAASTFLGVGRSQIVRTGMVMIHNVSSSARGDYHSMDKASEILQKANKAIVSAYIQKTGKTEEELLALMDRETWFTAKEAVEIGLVDKVMEDNVQLVASSFNGAMIPSEVIDKMRNQIMREKELECKLLQSRLENLKLKKL